MENAIPSLSLVSYVDKPLICIPDLFIYLQRLVMYTRGAAASMADWVLSPIKHKWYHTFAVLAPVEGVTLSQLYVCDTVVRQYPKVITKLSGKRVLRIRCGRMLPFFYHRFPLFFFLRVVDC